MNFGFFDISIDEKRLLKYRMIDEMPLRPY